MKVAVVGSRTVDDKYYKLLCENVPKQTSLIISGGAKGADQLAKLYSQEHSIDYLEFKPEYSKYGKAATIKRNKDIVNSADFVIILWDGKSRGSSFVMKYCIDTNTDFHVYLCS